MTRSTIGDAELAGRRQHPLALVEVAVVAEQQRDQRVAVRRGQQGGARLGLVGEGAAVVAVEAQHVAGGGARVEHHPAEHQRPDRVELVLERRDDAEIAAAAPERPEQVRMLVGAGGDERAVGGDDVGREQVVAGEAVLAHQPAEAAAQRQPADAGVGDGPAGRGEAERLGLAVEFAPEQAALGVGRARSGVDADALEAAQVDHQAAVAHGVAGRAVAAAAHRDPEIVLSSEVDGVDHVRDAAALHDHGRPAVDHAVPDLAGVVVAVVARADHRSANVLPQPLHRGFVDDALGSARVPNVQARHGLASSRPCGCEHRSCAAPLLLHRPRLPSNNVAVRTTPGAPWAVGCRSPHNPRPC